MIEDEEENSKVEERGTSGSVKWSLYAQYFSQGIGWFWFILLVLCLVLGQVCMRFFNQCCWEKSNGNIQLKVLFKLLLKNF